MTAPRLDSSQSLAEMLLRLPEAERDAFMATLTDQEIRLIEADLEHLAPEGQIEFLPHQLIPADSTGHLFTGGRGSGKTQGLAKNAVEHMKGPPCDARVQGGHRVLAVSPTAADAISALHYGPSGITALWPGTRLSQGADGAHLVTPNGVRVRLIGAFGPEDVERARAAGNTCLVLCDELATWKREEIWSNIDLGLRMGPRPRWIAATTPKNRKLFKQLLADPDVTRTHATIFDNPYLPEDIKAKWLRKYGGTRLGKQELDGDLLEAVEGALWTQDLIDAAQTGWPGSLVRTGIAVDPSGSEDGDETGILAGGVNELGQVFILEDASRAGSPEDRYTAVCMAAARHNAGFIVHESNFAGDNFSYGIAQRWKQLAAEKRVPPVCPRIKRTAARGSKADRMEPIVGLYEQNMIKHAPGLGTLEDQQLTWVPPHIDSETGRPDPGSSWSPDRIDPEVYLVRELVGGSGGAIEMDSGLTSEGQTLLASAEAAAESGGSLELLGDLADFGFGDGLGLHPALDRTFSALDRAFAGAVGIDVDGHGDGADFDSLD